MALIIPQYSIELVDERGSAYELYQEQKKRKMMRVDMPFAPRKRVRQR
jgi:hypothetical protein